MLSLWPQVLAGLVTMLADGSLAAGVADGADC